MNHFTLDGLTQKRVDKEVRDIFGEDEGANVRYPYKNFPLRFGEEWQRKVSEKLGRYGHYLENFSEKERDIFFQLIYNHLLDIRVRKGRREEHEVKVIKFDIVLRFIYSLVYALKHNSDVIQYTSMSLPVGILFHERIPHSSMPIVAQTRKWPFSIDYLMQNPEGCAVTITDLWANKDENHKVIVSIYVPLGACEEFLFIRCHTLYV